MGMETSLFRGLEFPGYGQKKKKKKKKKKSLFLTLENAI